MDRLDDLVLNVFRDTIYTPEHIRAVIDALRSHSSKRGGEDKFKAKKLEADLKEVEQAEIKLYEAIEKGVLDLDDRLKSRIQQHKTNREALVGELAILQRKQTTPLQTITPQKIEAVSKVLKKRLTISTPFSRAYLKATVSEIRINKDALMLTGERKAMPNLIASNGQIDPDNGVRGFIALIEP